MSGGEPGTVDTSRGTPVQLLVEPQDVTVSEEIDGMPFQSCERARKRGASALMALWAFTEGDVVQGLRERGLQLDSVDDLTAQELDLIREYVDLAFNKAGRELVDILTARIRRGRGI